MFMPEDVCLGMTPKAALSVVARTAVNFPLLRNVPRNAYLCIYKPCTKATHGSLKNRSLSSSDKSCISSRSFHLFPCGFSLIAMLHLLKKNFQADMFLSQG